MLNALAPQGGVNTDINMVAAVTDASISLYQTVLKQGLDKCKISGNASIVQAAYRLTQVNESIKHAAIAANIPHRYFDHVEINSAHQSIRQFPPGELFIPSTLSVQRLLLDMNDAATRKQRQGHHLSLVQNRDGPRNAGYQADLAQANHEVTLADDAYDLAVERYFTAAERRETNLKKLKFLCDVKKLTNITWTLVKGCFSSEFINGLGGEINGRIPRPPQLDIPAGVMAANPEIDPHFQIDLRDYLRHQDLLTEIQRRIGLSDPQKRRDYRNNLFSNRDYVMKKTNTVRDFTQNLLFPRLKCLEGHHEYPPLPELLGHLVHVAYNLDRFAVLHDKYNGLLSDPVYNASINMDEVNKVIKQYEDCDDAYWKRQSSRPVDVESNLVAPDPPVAVNSATVKPGKAVP